MYERITMKLTITKHKLIYSNRTFTNICMENNMVPCYSLMLQQLSQLHDNHMGNSVALA